MPKQEHAGPETPLGHWRRAHGQLRALERRLVDVAKTVEQPSELDPLFREVETMRSMTSSLFEAAQLQTLHRHFTQARH